MRVSEVMAAVAVQGLVAAGMVEALIRLWRVEVPEQALQLRRLALVLPVLGPALAWAPVFLGLAPQAPTLFEVRPWLDLTLPGGARLGVVAAVVAVASAALFVLQELVPALTRHPWVIRGARVYTGGDLPALDVALAAVAAAFGGGIPRVRIADDGGPMACVAGPWRPQLLVSRRLVALLAPEELRAALAHEAAHALRDDLRAGWAWFGLRAIQCFSSAGPCETRSAPATAWPRRARESLPPWHRPSGRCTRPPPRPRRRGPWGASWSGRGPPGRSAWQLGDWRTCSGATPWGRSPGGGGGWPRRHLRWSGSWPWCAEGRWMALGRGRRSGAWSVAEVAGPPALVAAGAALLLRLLAGAPGLLQPCPGKGPGRWDSLGRAEAELGVEIWVPAYLPAGVAWPPRRIRCLAGAPLTMSPSAPMAPRGTRRSEAATSVASTPEAGRWISSPSARGRLRTA